MENLLTAELKTKDFMERMFIPSLHKIIKEANPKEYAKWQGNCCIQTAIFGSLFLEQMLPDYEWSVWEGLFKDIVDGKERGYNHAWIYGINKKEQRRLLIDLSRNVHERLFILTPGNRYPKDHPDYVNMVELNRRKLNVTEKMKEHEFYTKLHSEDFLKKLATEIYLKVNSQENEQHEDNLT